MTLIDNTEITPEEIALEGLEALDKKYQKTVGFFAWDYFVAIGKILYTLWEKVIYIAKCLTDLSYMEYEDLENFVYQTRGIEARKETKSSGFLTLLNGEGTIRAGDIFQTSDGTRFQAIDTNKVYEGNKFEVECLEAGIIGNAPENSITIIPTTIQGIVSVTNETAFGGGYEKETKEDLLKRYYEDLRIPLTSGNKYFYKKWAKEVTGVKEAKVFPLWNGNNTVKVVIVDTNCSASNKDLVQEVQNYIDPYELKEDGTKYGWGFGNGQAPNGSYCTVEYATPLYLDLILTVQKTASKTEGEVKTNIKKVIDNYLKSISFAEDEDGNEIDRVSYARLSSEILEAGGVLDHKDLTINLKKGNIEVGKTEIPILKTLDINFATAVNVLNDTESGVAE